MLSKARAPSEGFSWSDVPAWGVALVAVPLSIFVVLAVVVSDDSKLSPDERLLMFLNGNVEGSALGGAAELLVRACLWLGLVILLALIGALCVRRRFASALFLGSVTAGSFVLEKTLKLTVERAAINHGQGYSFPSGSAMTSLAVVAALVLLSGHRRRAWAWAAGAGLVFVYGLSIVSLAWHYPSDVVAGWCVAVALVAALWLVLGRPTLERAPRYGSPDVRVVDFDKIT
jgi:membrane-associated phospholipid phosphatase